MGGVIDFFVFFPRARDWTQASHMLDKHSTTELHLQLSPLFSLIYKQNQSLLIHLEYQKVVGMWNKKTLQCF
jgi:hypothetical protein